MFVVDVAFILHIPVGDAGIFVGEFADDLDVFAKIFLAHVFKDIGQIEKTECAVKVLKRAPLYFNTVQPAAD